MHLSQQPNRTLRTSAMCTKYFCVLPVHLNFGTGPLKTPGVFGVHKLE